MNNLELTAIEKEMAAFNADDWKEYTQPGATAKLESAEFRDKLCSLWQRIRKFVKLAENIPFVGRYISILVTVLDGVCPQG